MTGAVAEPTRTVALDRISDYPAHHGTATPDADALVSAAGTVSYARFAADVEALARAMLAVGVRRGDRVATLAPPGPAYLTHFMAAGRVGAAWLGLNPRHTRSELAHVLRDAAPRLVLAVPRIEERDYADDVAELRRSCLADAVLVAVEGRLPGALEWRDLLRRGAQVGDDDLAAAQAAVTPDDIALIVYTSGTTGDPKGAMLSHRSIVATARIQCDHWWTQPFRILNNLPVNHIGGAVQLACHAIVAGGANVLMPRFDPQALPGVIRDHRVTVLHQVPTMYQLLLERGRCAPEDLAGVQVLIWSGAPAPRDLISRLRATGARLYTSYGQTETGGEVLYSREGAGDDELAAYVGVPDPRVGLRLADEAGTPVTTGEVQVRGDTVMSGYLNRPTETADAFTADGWLHTGDLAAVDGDGRFRIVGRLREMFKSGGYNVYPREVELALEQHPDVRLAAVLGVPDATYGEVGEAWVLSDAPLDDPALARHCRGLLANYKVPKAFHVHTELPLLPVGKIDKTALRRSRIPHAAHDS